MRDIIEVRQGQDLLVLDSIVAKAGNVLSIQIGSLEYAPDFGVDLKYFLQAGLEFQNESFKAYMVQRLAESQVNVSNVEEILQNLYSTYTYYVGETQPNDGGLIA